MVSVVCVLIKICVSSISLYKLDTDILTAPFELAHQFTLVCTVSDSKTVPGCHYNLCSNHSFVLTDYLHPLFVQRGFLTPWTHPLPLLYTDLCLLRPWSRAFFLFCKRFESAAVTIRTLPQCWTLSPMIEFLELHSCSVRIKGLHSLKWGMCSYSNTEQQYSIQWQDTEKALV